MKIGSIAIAALLFSVAQDLHEPEWHWTCEPFGSSYAWLCNFSYGDQDCSNTSYEGYAVAVRLIPLTS